MRLLNRRETENIRNMLLDTVDAWKARDPKLRKRDWKINVGDNLELIPLVKQLMSLTIRIYEVYGEEETIKHINAQCDELANLRIDKEGNINIDADEFTKRVSARIDRGDAGIALADGIRPRAR